MHFYTKNNRSLNYLFRFLFLTAVFTSTSLEVKAQWDYSVTGTVKKNKKKLEGAIVTLYKGSAIVQQISTPANGKFAFKLDQEADYTLSITKGGHITKKFVFSTRGVPEDRAKEPFGGQDLEVSIFEMPKDPNIVAQINSILSQPMAKFFYDDKQKEVDFDKNYSQSVRDALARLQTVEDEANKKAEEDAKKNADAEKNAAALEAAIASKYQAAIAKGDAAFGKKDYTTARAGYTEALDIKPGEAYPKGKIIEIEKLLADAAKNAGLEADYKAAIAKGDAALAAKTYDAAKAGYTDALKLKPAEAYPKTKLAEIDKLLADAAKNAELNAKYDAAIAKADKALAAKTYDAAKAGYNEALGLKPAEAYPKTKLAEIDKLLADLANKEKAEKELQAKYDAAIAKADKALAAKTYDAAKAGYTEALGFKPAEAYPKTKIAEIDKLLADLAAKDKTEKELNDKYNAAIAKGDKALAAKTYDAAKAGYTEALGLKAAEQYPKDKIAEIDKLLAELANKEKAEKDKLAKEKELNDKYNAAIAKADKALAAKTYDAAKAGYNEALGVKSAEQYPKDKIAEIDALIAKELGAKELNAKYDAAIAKADKALAAKTYDDAKTGYNEALGFKPAEAYPKTKLAEIDKLLADAASKDKAEKDRLAKEKELAEKYAAAIAKADAALGTKDYTNAKAAYNEALTYKTTEKYPKDKIAEIDAILAKEMGAKAAEEKYKAAIAKGDAALAKKDYTTAKAGYTDAVGLKPAEQYPKDKLAEIDKALGDAAAEKDKLAKAAELEAKYKAAIAKADAALKVKTYDAAKTSYNEALGLKPAEQYPKDKIAEIDALIAKDMGAKELDEKYKAAVAKADAALKAKTYDAAKTGYNEALGFKPAEAYPKTKLAEIDKLLADAAAKDANEKDRLAKEKELAEKYAAAIAKADAALGTKDYANAKSAYTEALGFKPAEKYPKDKIAEIDAILAKEMGAKAVEEKYKAAIAKGDAAMETKDYSGAKTQYTTALSLKPTEQYPKDKLAEIEKALAELAAASKGKELETKYQAAIAKGDKALGTKTYDAAKAGYNEALGLKPAEQYPKDKLAEIDKALADANSEKDKLAQQKALDTKYAAAIAKADKAFAAKTYDAAKAGYNEALSIKASEQYPKDKLAAIDKLLAEMANKDASSKELSDKYNAAIAKADAAFGGNDYSAAKAAYNEALGLKPSEKYPKDKIAAIDALLAKETNAKEAEEKYKAIIAKADIAFNSKDYTTAKTSYTEALSLKASETYPKDQLSKIEQFIADAAKNKSVQAKYDAAIAKADAALEAKDYSNAMAAYKEAQSVKPNEPYPVNKISEVNRAMDNLSRASAKEQQYKDLIAKADKFFTAKDYKQARTAYSDALLVKVTEKYPKDKIAEIDALTKNKTNTTTVVKDNKDDFKSELAKKYPEGITEESATEMNSKIIRRIVVKGNEGHLYIQKTTSFGPIYYFKDDVPITEKEYLRDTEIVNK
jgi:hypothetical protein